MEDVTDEPAELTKRVAALDIGKASLVCCLRVPHESRPGACRQEVRSYDTVTPALLELRDWLICQGVTRVVMEATSAYWKPPYHLEDGIECWVVNARDVKNVPGRPKTDGLDSVCSARPGRPLIAQMVVELAFQSALDHHLGQPAQQPALAGQLQPARAGPLGQLPQHPLISRRQLRLVLNLILRHVCHWCLSDCRELRR
jgi:hypothetical protein